MDDINNFCNNLKQNVGPSAIKVIQLGDDKFTPKIYYLPENFIDGFMVGEMRLLFLLNESNDIKAGGTAGLNYRDHWKPDMKFINIHENIIRNMFNSQS